MTGKDWETYFLLPSSLPLDKVGADAEGLLIGPLMGGNSR